MVSARLTVSAMKFGSDGSVGRVFSVAMAAGVGCGRSGLPEWDMIEVSDRVRFG
jgi:hypothetical protein